MTESVRPRSRPAAAPVAENPLTKPGSEIAQAMSKLGKMHGPSVIRRADLRPQFKHTPTGVFVLDIAMLGGVPEGLGTMFYGWEHSGKTTMALRALARAQEKYPDKVAALIDLEGTYDPAWGALHGIQNDRLALAQPPSGETALDIAVSLIRAHETSMVVVDSLAALTPMKEREKSFEDSTVGEQARMISRFCRVTQSEFLEQRKRDHYPAVIAINQFRMKVGVVYGDPRVLPGGFAQNFFATVKVEMKNKEHMGKDGVEANTVDYNEHAFTVKKNKIGTSIREGEFVMVRNSAHPLGMGFIDDAKTVVTWAKKTGVVTGGGSSWRVDGIDERFGNLQEIADYCYSDLEWFEVFKRRLISEHRERQGLNPAGWY